MVHARDAAADEISAGGDAANRIGPQIPTNAVRTLHRCARGEPRVAGDDGAILRCVP